MDNKRDSSFEVKNSFTETERSVVQDQTNEYISAAESAALRAIKTSFEERVESNCPSDVEVQALIEALLRIGMAFPRAMDLVSDIMERYDHECSGLPVVSPGTLCMN